MLVTTFKSVIIALSKRDARNNLDSMKLSTEKVFKMQIITKRSFVASTAVPLVKITFDVYAQKQHFEVIFTLKDEAAKKTIAQNLRKVISTIVLIESELSENEYFEFLAKLVTALDDHRTLLIDGTEKTSQIDFLKMIMQEIALYKAKQAKKALKK